MSSNFNQNEIQFEKAINFTWDGFVNINPRTRLFDKEMLILQSTYNRSVCMTVNTNAFTCTGCACGLSLFIMVSELTADFGLFLNLYIQSQVEMRRLQFRFLCCHISAFILFKHLEKYQAGVSFKLSFRNYRIEALSDQFMIHIDPRHQSVIKSPQTIKTKCWFCLFELFLILSLYPFIDDYTVWDMLIVEGNYSC